MNNIKASIKQWEGHLENRWVQLPRKQQQRIVLYCFIGYLLNTIVVVNQIWYEAAKPRKEVQVEHISNPILEKGKPTEPTKNGVSATIKKEPK